MPEDKKLIIDEDWKSQVEAEKKQAQAPAPNAAAGSEPAASGGAGEMQMPPASFELLLTMLGTEALTAMGQLPHPATGQMEAHRGQAKYIIDTIDVLREKTKGNLSADEQEMIEGILHQLRMVFVESGRTV